MSKKLLSDGKNNSKTALNSLPTYYLSLQPALLNSKKENLCRFSTADCRKECLQFAGRQIFSNVVKSRQRKTEYFVNNRKEFLTELWGELEKINKKGKAAVRLNLLSDVDWEMEFLKIGKKFGTLNNIIAYK